MVTPLPPGWEEELERLRREQRRRPRDERPTLQLPIPEPPPGYEPPTGWADEPPDEDGYI